MTAYLRVAQHTLDELSFDNPALELAKQIQWLKRLIREKESRA